MKNSKIHDIMNLAALFPVKNMVMQMPVTSVGKKWASCLIKNIDGGLVVSILTDDERVNFKFIDLVSDPVEIIIYDEDNEIILHLFEYEDIEAKYKEIGKKFEMIIIECLYANNLEVPRSYIS